MVRVDVALPKEAALPPPEADIQELLYRFEEAIHQGAPCSFATLRELWLKMNFALVFERCSEAKLPVQTRPLHLTQEEYVQSLFASALDCLQVPLQPRQLRPLPVAPQRQEAGQPSGSISREGNGAPGSSFQLPPGLSMSVEDLVASDSDEDLEHQQQIAKSLLGWSRKEGTPYVSEAAPSAGTPSGQASGLDANRDGSEPPADQPAAPSGEDALEQVATQDPLRALSALELLPDLTEDVQQLANDSPGAEGVPKVRGVLDLGIQLGAGEPCRGPSEQPKQDAVDPDHVQTTSRSPVPDIVRIGSIFLLYALYFSQPSNPLTRIYVPLQLLRGLTWMCGRSREADAALRRLNVDDAFVVGAVRRPISGTKLARMAGRQAKSILQPDRMEQRRLLRQSVRQLRVSVESWSRFQHLQLLCNSYQKAQANLWGDQQHLAKGLFDLNLGNGLASMVEDIKEGVNRVLPYTRSRFLAIQKAPESAEADNSRPGPKKRTVITEREPQEAEEDGKKAVEKAAARRQKRLLQANDDEMPSMEELGLSIPGETGAEIVEAGLSRADIQLLPKAARLVEERRAVERMEFRRSMSSWQKVFKMRNGQLQKANPEAAPKLDAGAARPSKVPAAGGLDANGNGAAPKNVAKRRSCGEPCATASPPKKQKPTNPVEHHGTEGARGNTSVVRDTLGFGREKERVALSGSVQVIAESAASTTQYATGKPPLRQKQAREKRTSHRELPKGSAVLNARQPNREEKQSNNALQDEDPSEGPDVGCLAGSGSNAREDSNDAQSSEQDSQDQPGVHEPTTTGSKRPRETQPQMLDKLRAEAIQSLMDADAEAARLLSEL